MNAQQHQWILEAVHELSRVILTVTGRMPTDLSIGVPDLPKFCLYGTAMDLGTIGGVRVRLQKVESEQEKFDRVRERAELLSKMPPMPYVGLLEDGRSKASPTVDVVDLLREQMIDALGVPKGLPESLKTAVEAIAQDALKNEAKRRLEKLVASFTHPPKPAAPMPKATDGRSFVRRTCPKCLGRGDIHATPCTLCDSTTFVYTDGATREVICPGNQSPTGQGPRRDADGRSWCVSDESDLYSSMVSQQREEVELDDGFRMIVPRGRYRPGDTYNNGRRVVRVVPVGPLDPPDRHGSLHYKKRRTPQGTPIGGPDEPDPLDAKKCDECGGSGTYESPLTGKRSPCSRGCRP